MAYPPVPGRRMAWDADASVFLTWSGSNPISERSAGDAAEANDEDNVLGVTIDPAWVIVIFPELREVDGFFIAGQKGTGAPPNFGAAEYSPDTTNGIDGTWNTSIANVSPDETTVFTRYRDGILSTAHANVRGFRVYQAEDVDSIQLRGWHLYGEISAGETPDRLIFIDEATGLDFTAARDYGDVPRGGSEDVEWRIKNNSASLTATTIQYTTEDLYLGAGAWYTHTLPGGATYQATRNLTSLAPVTTSGLIKTRRIIPGGFTPNLTAARTYLDTGSWV